MTGGAAEIGQQVMGTMMNYELMNYRRGFMTLYRRQELRPSPRKRNAKKQNGCLRRPYKQLRKDKK